MTKLFANLKGWGAFILIVVNTLFWCPLLLIVAFCKFAIPIKQWRKLCTKGLTFISESWSCVNNFNIDWYLNMELQLEGMPELSKEGNYLLISNHQSWLDIIVLQKLFNKKIPFFKFFLKKELIFIPILGLAWWALDYPFMRRYTKKMIEEKPELAGKDMEITRKACEKYQNSPVSIVNFLEGTRYTKAKHKRQNSPYKHLLKPKAGGIAFVLGAMGEQLSHILNVTIVYPEGNVSFWKFLTGRQGQVTIHVDKIEISKKLIGNYTSDETFRKQFQSWVNGIWEEKDAILSRYTK